MEHREQNRSKQTWALAATLAVSVGGATVGGVTAGCGAMAGDVSSLEEGKRDFTVEARVSGGGDDAVESIGGVSLSSTQLELGAGAASGEQFTGIRFAQLAVPPGATVTNARLAFTVDEVSTGAAWVRLRAEAADDAQPFTDAPGNLSTRSLTAAEVAWEPGEWLEVGAEQASADLTPLIQEVVNRPGWSEGSPLALIASGEGKRTAQSFDADPAAAPSLTVAFAILPGSCLPGELRCTGSVLERCNATATDFELMAVFVTPQLCQDAQQAAQCIPDDGGECAAGNLGNGQACTVGAQCTSGNCVDGVCCDGACGAPCETCAGTGICRAVGTDPVCGTVSCSSFDAACVTNTTNSVNACLSRGQCRTTVDCGFRSATTRCGTGGLCDGQGVCQGPSVVCGTQTCSAANACCFRQDINTGVRTQACGANGSCNLPGTGPIVRVACDQHADCSGNDVCCLVTTNVNSGQATCRQTCTAQAVGAEMGVPPEMLVVGQLCASPAGQILLPCPAGQACRAAAGTLPTQFSICRQ